MSRRLADAGFTLLELLVGLAIFSGLAALAASTMTPGKPALDTAREVRRFVTVAVSEAVLSGKAGLLRVDAGVITYKGKTLVMDDHAGPAVRLVVHADGTLVGDAVAFERSTGVVPPGVFQ